MFLIERALFLARLFFFSSFLNVCWFGNVGENYCLEIGKPKKVVIQSWGEVYVIDVFKINF